MIGTTASGFHRTNSTPGRPPASDPARPAGSRRRSARGALLDRGDVALRDAAREQGPGLGQPSFQRPMRRCPGVEAPAALGPPLAEQPAVARQPRHRRPVGRVAAPAWIRPHATMSTTTVTGSDRSTTRTSAPRPGADGQPARPPGHLAADERDRQRPEEHRQEGQQGDGESTGVHHRQVPMRPSAHRSSIATTAQHGRRRRDGRRRRTPRPRGPGRPLGPRPRTRRSRRPSPAAPTGATGRPPTRCSSSTPAPAGAGHRGTCGTRRRHRRRGSPRATLARYRRARCTSSTTSDRTAAWPPVAW